jgi:hypothetical protein
MNTEKFFSILNFTLNKFCPIAITSFLLFFNFGFSTYEPYVIIGLFIFTQRFHYGVGYSIALCQERNLLDE